MLERFFYSQPRFFTEHASHFAVPYYREMLAELDGKY